MYVCILYMHNSVVGMCVHVIEMLTVHCASVVVSFVNLEHVCVCVCLCSCVLCVYRCAYMYVCILCISNRVVYVCVFDNYSYRR